MTLPPNGRPVILETERFLLRSLKPSDASERWINWLRDPEVMAPLNAPIRAWTTRELMAHIATSDNIERFIIGVFDKTSKIQIGMYMVEIDSAHRRATFNVVIGEKAWWGRSVVNETRAALLDEFFERRGIEKAVGVPLVRNFPAVFNYKAQGWRLEGVLRGHCLAVAGDARLDQYQFGLLKSEWLAQRNTP